MSNSETGGMANRIRVHKAVYRQKWVGVRWQAVKCGRSTYNFKKGQFHLLTEERWNKVTCKDCLKHRPNPEESKDER